MEQSLVKEQQGNIIEEEIEIILEEKETGNGLQLGFIKNIDAFNDMLKYTKKYKKQSGLFIVFNKGEMKGTNNELLQFHDDHC